MKILGIDTSTKFLCLGVYDEGRIYQYNLECGRKISSLLTPTIKRVVEALNWQASDIDYFACGLGPGSFTGLRIAVATIKGMAWSLNKPLLGISSLDILAKNAAADAVVIPAIDAKRNLIYCSIYKNKKGILRRTAPYMLLSIDEFLKKVKPNSVLLGDALGLYKEKILENTSGVTILDKDYWQLNGSNIIYLALEKLKGKKINNAFDIKPIYLYPKECQIKNKSI